jgi:hypothetical protein
MKRLTLFLLAISLAVVPAATARGAANPAPAWRLSTLAAPTDFKPGESRNDYYQVEATNYGGGATSGAPIVLTDRLPAGLTVKSIELIRKSNQVMVDLAPKACASASVSGAVEVTCTVDESLTEAVQPATLKPSERFVLVIHVGVPKTASGTLVNKVEIEGGAPMGASAVGENLASAKAAPPGLEEFHTALTGADGAPVTQAASHPFAYTTSFASNTELAPEGSAAPLFGAGGDLKDLEFNLPPGLVGNPTVTAKCTAQQLATTHSVSIESHTYQISECPDSAAVGIIELRQLEGRSLGPEVGPLYNMVTPPGMPAEFGFQIFGLPFYIETQVRTGSDYGITAILRNASQAKRITAASVTLWGDPGAAIHDGLRGECAETGGTCVDEHPDPRSFLRLPSSCGNPLLMSMAFDNWTTPGDFRTGNSESPPVTGCELLPFSPTIETIPTNGTTDSPTGLEVDLHIPQREGEEAAEGMGEADLRNATVTLPEGLVINPASADGQGVCTEGQIGFEGESEGSLRFTPGAAECPESAKVGSVQIDTPLLDHPLPGAVYLAKQTENPFGSLLAIYIAVHDPQTGVVVKLAGKVDPDPRTGRLSATFTNTPQLPFEDFKLSFFKGDRAPLRTSQTCGSYSTTTSLTPWSAPASGPAASPSSPAFSLTAVPGDGPCVTKTTELPNAPAFEAGMTEPFAGAYSPFLLHLSRQDGSQELSGLSVDLPPGLLGRLAGVAECSEAQIAAARSREVPGGGRAEQSSPSCPSTSQLGTVVVGAGAGPDPYYVTGDAYLAGPYKGAPLSMVIITPAVAGPFDLGAVVVRAALEVDPETARIHVVSDPFPQVLDGIPLDLRSIVVRVDRNQFTINPTSCEVMSITGQATSVTGQTATLGNRFQVGGCDQLKFKPKLKLSLKGSTTRTGHPGLKAVLTYPKGGAYANVARAQVNLPHSEFIEQNNLNKTCTKPILLERKCPKTTVYGTAEAWTPLLDKPLQGNVYLVGGFGYKLPALVAELDGQIRVLLKGKVDSGPNGGIRNTFEAVPDAPVEKFELNLKGGPKYSLLVNSENLCKKPQKAIARFTAQNGKVLQTKPLIANECKKKSKVGGKKKSKGAKKKASAAGGTNHKK